MHKPDELKLIVQSSLNPDEARVLDDLLEEHTMSFQAPAFYEKKGYTVFEVLEGIPKEYKLSPQEALDRIVRLGSEGNGD